MMRTKVFVGLLVAAAALAFGGVAEAATYTVWAGPGFLTAAPAGAPQTADINAFFPSRLKIHVGDTVIFKSDDFHTATYLAGKKPSDFPIFVKDSSGGTYTGISDANGAPFWFNGMPKFLYNGAALAPSGPTTIQRGVFSSSGVLSKQGYSFTFTRQGDYTFHCLVHPMMTLHVTVKPRKARVDSTRRVAGEVQGEVAFGVKVASQLDKLAPTQPNTVYAGVGKMVPGGSVELMTFKPQVLTVKVGTTVTWVNDSAMEPHNMIFGPTDYAKQTLQNWDLIPTGPGAANQVYPFFFYGSDPLTGPYSYDGTNHGNGFLATPVIGPMGSGLPTQFAITFTKAGDYTYFCGIHGPTMHGEIIVTS